MFRARKKPDPMAMIEEVCKERAVILDKNDPILRKADYERDRIWRESLSPIEHGPLCNLRPGYSQDPLTWAKGCDCGATAKASAKLAR